MNCVILITQGEVLSNAHFIKEMGYNFELYPTTQDTSRLVDSRYQESADYVGRSPESCEKPLVRSLRASFIRMLEDTRYKDNDEIIFCESDASPRIPAAQLRPIVHDLLQKNPDADVIRLYHTVDFCTEYQAREFENEEIAFSLMPRCSERDVNRAHVWGTHALIIPAKSRKKVASILSEYRLPIDIALEAAHGKGEISILASSANLFAQFRRTVKPTPYKIAVLLSSYKRYNELQRQIWCMMDQDYAHDYHLFVAAKGLSEACFNQYLYPQFQHFIDAGRLTLRHFPNKNQLSNVLDTIRGLDVSEYELFAKIDDDDIYTRNYLSTINAYHELLPRDVGSYFCGRGSFLQNVASYPRFAKARYWCYGSTMVFPPKVLEFIFNYEDNPHHAITRGEGSERLVFGYGYGFTEDALLDRINQFLHATNRATYNEVNGYSDSVCVSQMHASVTRGNYVAKDFLGKNGAINKAKENNEIILEVRHPHWAGLFRILNNRVIHLNTGCGANILEFNDGTIRVKWDNWGEEIFRRDKDGVYHFSNETIKK